MNTVQPRFSEVPFNPDRCHLFSVVSVLDTEFYRNAYLCVHTDLNC